VIGFGGRSLGETALATTGRLPQRSASTTKYLSPHRKQTFFSKGKTLFGFDKARTVISREDQAVVVEGYFDAIALHAAGITNVVASLGTALSLDQVRQVLRYTESKQLVLNFDADAAGTQAAERAIGEIPELAYQGRSQLEFSTYQKAKMRMNTCIPHQTLSRTTESCSSVARLADSANYCGSRSRNKTSFSKFLSKW